MLFVQDTNDCPARTKTFCRKDPPGLGYELLATSYLYHLCQILKAWNSGLVDAVFGGWPGGCQNFIFSNTIKTFCRNNPPGSGYELVATVYLYHLCRISKAWRLILVNVDLLATGYLHHLWRVSKAWRFGLVNAVFEGWLGDYRNSIFSNTIKTICRNNLPG